jgi:hypothetical protein
LSPAIAFECYSDEDVLAARLGLVDEDPLGTHHVLRDRLEVVSRSQSIEIRRSGERYLVVLRPDLERCFLASVKRLKCESKLPDDHRALRRLLVPGHPKHALFRAELKALHQGFAHRVRSQGSLKVSAALSWHSSCASSAGIDL